MNRFKGCGETRKAFIEKTHNESVVRGMHGKDQGI